MINQMIDQQAERTAKRARVDEAAAILAANDGNNPELCTGVLRSLETAPP